MKEEAMIHDEFEKLGRELLRHKYLYYVKAQPEISDYEYDQLEAEYTKMSLGVTIEPEIHLICDWYEREWLGNNGAVVGFPENHPWVEDIISEVEGA